MNRTLNFICLALKGYKTESACVKASLLGVGLKFWRGENGLKFGRESIQQGRGGAGRGGAGRGGAGSLDLVIL